MPSLSPIGLWRIYLAVTALAIVTAWGYALAAAATGEAGGIAYLPAILLSVLLVASGTVVRSTALRLQLAQRGLRKEIRRSRKVFENMEEGVLLLDLRGRVSFANAAARVWLPDARGHHFASVIARAGFALTNEDGSALANADPIRSFCLKRGCDLDGVWLTQTARDDNTWLAVKVKVLKDDSDAVTGATLTITDRSEEHEHLTESALSASILANMHDAVMITDAQGIIVRVNPAFTHLTGYGGEEILGQPADALRSVEHGNDLQAEYRRQLEHVGHWSGRYWNRRKSGEEYCVWQTVTSIRDTRGNTVRHIAVSRDITEQEMRENELWQRANFDPLTGLGNRTRFTDRVEQTLAHAQRHGRQFALCYLDLDHFKPVNDTFGHAAGDALLCLVAQRMRNVLRDEDLLARIGGDEFALLLPQTQHIGDAANVAKKIVDVLGKPFILPEGQAHIGISIGIAHYPQDGASAPALTAAADCALYQAKAEGRNGWRYAAEASTADA